METRKRMPVLFAGHGSPMNAIEKTVFGDGLRSLGAELARPRAVLMVSAHWQTDGTEVVGGARPKIIYDFGGFPQALFDFQYPVLGAPELASRILGLIPSLRITESWGLDHGSWSVLTHLFPDADIPVVQLSLDRNLSFSQHLELAQGLRPLRDEGVLIVGSGNIVHNLRLMKRTGSATEAPQWAQDFDRLIAEAVVSRDLDKLAKIFEAWPELAALAVPTPEHYLPLLYTLGATDSSDSVTFPITGFQMSAISMRTALWK